MERLVRMDCDEQVPLQAITRAVTELAEFALDAACSHAFAELDALHGAPRGADGRRAELWVVGMGKLGARELNVSSDIDLIYVYDQDGDTAATPGPQRRVQPGVFRQGGAHHLWPGGRHDRTRLCVPRGPGAAAQWQLGAARGVAGRAGRVFPGAGARVGALCLAQEPHHRAARLRGQRLGPGAARCGTAVCVSPLPGLQRV
jgi:hypothetical protein